MSFVDIKIDENEVRKIYFEKLEQHINKIDTELTFWDSKELCRQTCMSWDSIQKEFFFDKRFEKYKIGHKWRFPAEDTRKFLLMWIREQKTR
jgi:hypothetical protein